MICTGKSRSLQALVQAQPNFMSDGGIFVRKWILFFLILVFADVFAISSLKEHVSLDTLREAGIPVEEMEKAGMSPREMRLYLPFWQDMEYFPLAVRPQEREDPFSFTDTWMEERNYGGKRKHEGCDIFGKAMLSGYYPVIRGESGMAPFGRLEDWNPKSERRLFLLCPSERLRQRIFGGGICEGGRASGIFR